MKRIQYMPLAFMPRINQLLDESGLNAHQLSKKLGLSANTISEWLSDSRVMSTVSFFELCKFFDVNPMWLYGLTDERKCFEE